MLLGEVNLKTKQLLEYFGDGGPELDMQTNFPVTQAMYLALARERAEPLASALTSQPDLPDDRQWAYFVRNHDELTLDKLTPKQRQEVFEAFAPEESMRIFDRGIRRRLPPMLEGDQDRIRLAYSLAFTLPGTPILFYGEEIGMGDNQRLHGRTAVRTPMQWSDGPNGGFSTSDDLVRSLVTGEFGPLSVNVSAGRRNPDSLWSWMQRAIHRRRETPEFGWGDLTVLDVGDPAVLAHTSTWEESVVLAIHNFSPDPRVVEVKLDGIGDALVDDLLEQGTVVELTDGRMELKLGRYAHRWFRVRHPRRPQTP